MLAVCNADYEFTLIDIGEAGRQSDGGVFSNSNLGYAIVNDLLDFPEPENVNDSDFTLPFVFVGDDAFPMRNLVKLYSAFHLDLEKLITYYRTSRARRIIENTFRFLAPRFRIFRRPILAMAKKCCFALHNYLMAGRLTDEILIVQIILLTRKSEIKEKTENGDWWLKMIVGLFQYTKLVQIIIQDAKIVRDSFCEYFNSNEGQIPWKRDMVSVEKC